MLNVQKGEQNLSGRFVVVDNVKKSATTIMKRLAQQSTIRLDKSFQYHAVEINQGGEH